MKAYGRKRPSTTRRRLRSKCKCSLSFHDKNRIPGRYFAKTCFSATATAEKSIKGGLEFCFSRMGGKTLLHRHPVIFSTPDPDVSFTFCLFSEERSFLYGKMPLVTNAVSVPLKHSWGNFMICWSVWLTHSAAQLPGP